MPTIFSQKFTPESGILSLMSDLGSALAQARQGGDPLNMLGGGNPAYIPAVQDFFRQAMQDILDTPGEFEHVVGNYASPAGDVRFRAALAALFAKEFGWQITERNICLTNGSQTAFFYLFNLFAGPYTDGSFKKILLPLAPEYIGYVDVGMHDALFKAYRPEITCDADGTYKYSVDFNALQVTDEIGAICVSRPTNPTGNVLTQAEVTRLHALSQQHGIPFIIDNAYGTPFPNIISSEAQPIWDENIILCMSLSKLGMPGVRTGIVVANDAVIEKMGAMNAIYSLAPGNFGAALALQATRNGDILRISNELIAPYYANKTALALNLFRELFANTPARVHKAEGAFFLWFWFPDLPIHSQELYQRLKARNTIVVAGHHFYPGLPEAWQHKQECIRVSIAGSDDTLISGIRTIAEEVKRAYQHK
jgi:valine--pyruvate aminotransferase